MGELLQERQLEVPPESEVAGAGRMETVIVTTANLLWSVVGLVLWVPQLARVVLTSVVRLVHSALTRQSAEAVRGPIRRVSRFYRDGFLRLGQSRPGGSYRSRELRLGRFLAEAIWVIGFWLLVLALVWREAFEAVWQLLAAGGLRIGSAAAVAADKALALVPDSLPGPSGLAIGPVLAAVGALLLGLVAGFLLGRRRR